MPRQPSDRVEEGFELWSTEAERNDTRTAELMGLSQSTVSYWHRAYRWDARYLSFIQPDAEIMVGVGIAALRQTLPAVTQRLIHIATAKKPVCDAQGTPIGEVYAAQDRDAIQAAKLVYQYALSTIPADGWPRPIDAQVQFPPRTETPVEEMSGAELHAAACRILEETVQAVNTRPSSSRKRV